MLVNYFERQRHWNEGWKTINQGDSIDFPFSEYKRYFIGDILEIGPGEGRQAKVLMKEGTSYSIADIVQVVLDQPIYDSCDKKILIKDWGINHGVRFDVIHFWYVLHHVPSFEISYFVKFLYTHTKPKGKILFNTPFLEYNNDNYSDNGIMTTKWKIGEIIQVLDPNFFCLHVDGTKYHNSNGYIYVGERRD